MTVSAVIRKAGPTPGNGVAIAFPFAFKVFAAVDLLVQTTLLADGTITALVLNDPLGYTVVLNPDQNTNPGGTVTYNPAGVPMPATKALTITSAMAKSQGTHITNGGAFFANNLEDNDDKNMMAVQDLAVQVNASLQFPSVDATLNAVLPAAAQRANKTLGFDALGNVIAGGVATSIVAAAWQTVVQAATLALGRAAMGFSAYFDSLIGVANAAALRVLLTVLTTKGDLWTFAAADARLAVGADGKVLAADSSQASGLVYIDDLSRPNLLINPNWQIDQINEGALYTINGAAANGPDGWSGEAVGGGGGVFKLRAVADPDNAALKCLEITCTTVDAAIAAAERYSIYAAIEGYDAVSLQAGVASAQQIIVQFKFKTSVPGVYGVSIANSAKNRSYVGIITVADALEHEYSLALTMDTAGAWLYTNGVGLYLRLTLAGGANFQAVAGAWNAADNYCTAAQANFMSNIANIAYLKRIQLLPGALVQAYRPADLQKELAKANRQYAKTYDTGVIAAAVSPNGQLAMQNYFNAAQALIITWQYPTRMRVAPTVTSYAPATGTAARWTGSGSGDLVATAVSTGETAHVASTTAAANENVKAHFTANARLS